MLCISCNTFSWQIICKTCQNRLLRPYLNKRVLDSGLIVYSFYDYDELKELLKIKYFFHGDLVFSLLSKLTFAKFAQNFEFEEGIFSLAIDDRVKNYFSHTAILNRSLKSKHITPLPNKLHAQNSIKYAGKDLKFRQSNPRNFQYSGAKGLKVIVVDDIVTTGTTLNEASKVLKKSGCETLFALCLVDSKSNLGM
jgi:competence protein ComFC